LDGSCPALLDSRRGPDREIRAITLTRLEPTLPALVPLRRLAAPLVLAVAAAACSREDPRVANLSVGISKDSAITAMGGERPSRIDPYLTGGQYIEAMYYIRPGGEPAAGESVPDREQTPVVAVNGILTGWGWAHWDSVASANNIPVAPKD